MTEFYFVKTKCWLAFLILRDSIFNLQFSTLIFHRKNCNFDSMIVSLYCGLSSKAVFATKCLKRSQASRPARPRKKWSKDVRKIHGHVVKIRVYCWLRSLCKRYHILTVLINPSIKWDGKEVVLFLYVIFYYYLMQSKEYMWNTQCPTVCANPMQKLFFGKKNIKKIGLLVDSCIFMSL